MKTFLLLLISLACLSGVQSQRLVQPSDTVMIKPGNSHKLSCQGFDYTFSSHYMTWIRQAPNGGLQWMSAISNGGGGSTYYHDSVKGRFTISRDDSNNMLYLQMTNLKTEDSVVYYCARDYNNWALDLWGNGQMVTVTAAERITPDVFPIIAVGQTDSNSITIACLANHFFPEPASITITTTSGETPSGVRDFKTSLTGDPPAYNLLSQVTVHNSDFESKNYQCRVKHYSTDVTKNIPKGCASSPEEPSAHLLQGTCPETNYGEVALTCQAYNLTSQEATLKWYINDQERKFPQDQIELGKTQRLFFAMQSTVAISKAEWNNGVRVKCHVTDSKTGKTAEDTINKCSDSLNCLGINVFMVQPSIEDLFVHKTAPIACVASNLKHSTSSYSFKWSFPGASPPLNVQSEDSVLQENGTYSVSSVLIVSPDTWQQHTEFTCNFYHPDVKTPIITRIRKEKETKTSQPMVSVFPPSAEELALKETCTLICIAHNFRPMNIYMGWTKNNMEVSKDRYINSESKLESNGAYFIVSKLTIPTSDWYSETIYGCLVGHETIPMNFIRKSIDKNSGKPTNVKVSVYMSDTELSCY